MRVAVAMLEDPRGQHWGYELSRRSGVRSGVLYPILTRMLSHGWLTDGWESEESAHGRPRRRYYTLTDEGRVALGGIIESECRKPRFGPLFKWA